MPDFSRHVTEFLRNFKRAVSEMSNAKKFITKNGKIRLIYNNRVFCPITAVYRRINGSRVNLNAIYNVATMSNAGLNMTDVNELYNACDTTEDTPLRQSLLEIAGLNNAVPVSST